MVVDRTNASKNKKQRKICIAGVEPALFIHNYY